MNKMSEKKQVHYCKLPLKYLSLKISSFSDICTTKSFNVFVKFVQCTFLLLTFLFQNTKNSQEATYAVKIKCTCS